MTALLLTIILMGNVCARPLGAFHGCRHRVEQQCLLLAALWHAGPCKGEILPQSLALRMPPELRNTDVELQGLHKHSLRALIIDRA